MKTHWYKHKCKPGTR